MRNPFRFDGFLTGKDFCDRDEEIKEITSYANNRANVLLFSKRRYGKSSLLVELFENRLDENYLKIYVDLYGVESVADFAHRVSRAFAKSQKILDIKSKLLELKELFKRVSFSIGVDENGLPEFRPEILQSDTRNLIEELFSGIEKYAKKHNLVAILALDEFQESIKISEEFTANLRSVVQSCKEISYIFCGSKRHLLTDMFTNTQKPFYSLALPFELQKIPEHLFFTYCKERFEQKRLLLGEAMFNEIYTVSLGETKLIQMLCYFIYQADEDKEIEGSDIKKAVDTINRLNHAPFAMFFDTLTQNQRKALKILSSQNTNIFSKETIKAFDISAQSIKSAIASLEEKEIVFRENQAYFIYNQELTLWLQNETSKNT